MGLWKVTPQSWQVQRKGWPVAMLEVVNSISTFIHALHFYFLFSGLWSFLCLSLKGFYGVISQYAAICVNHFCT